jgi:positive regulator of sigma E activity
MPSDEEAKEPGVRVEYGKITAIGNGMAEIHVDPSDECSACSLQGHCHTDSDKHPVLHLPAPEGTDVGQFVAVHVTKSSRLGLASLVYLLPLVTATAGALLGDAYGDPARSDVNGMLGFGIGLLAAVLVVVPVAVIGTRKGKWRLEIIPSDG